jgi:hypothetical protein
MTLTELTLEMTVNVWLQPPPRAFVHKEIGRQQADRRESLSGGVENGLGDCSRLSGVGRMGAPVNREVPATAWPGGGIGQRSCREPFLDNSPTRSSAEAMRVFRAHRVRIIPLPPRLMHVLGALAAGGVGRSCLAVRATEDSTATRVHWWPAG